MKANQAYIYVKAYNGITVRIPKNKYPQWKAGQEKLAAGETLPEAQQMSKQLASLIKGES